MLEGIFLIFCAKKLHFSPVRWLCGSRRGFFQVIACQPFAAFLARPMTTKTYTKSLHICDFLRENTQNLLNLIVINYLHGFFAIAMWFLLKQFLSTITKTCCSALIPFFVISIISIRRYRTWYFLYRVFGEFQWKKFCLFIIHRRKNIWDVKYYQKKKKSKMNILFMTTSTKPNT